MTFRPATSIATASASALLHALVVASSVAAQAADPPRVWPDEGPFTWAPRPTQPGILADDLRTHVYQLAADSMAGRAAGTRGNFMATTYVAAVFQRLGLRPAGENGTYFQTVPVEGAEPNFPARNVIAILPGSDPALRGQYVLVGAHNDHEGVLPQALDHDALRAFNRVMRPQGANDRPGAPTSEQQTRMDSLIAHARSIRPPRPDTVMNGADDDASGTGVLLEIAESFARGEAPRRSIIFISHAAEEAGLVGSRYFTDNPTVPLDSIVAAHNMDMLGNGGVTDVRFGGPAQVQMLGARRLSAEFGDMIDSLNAVREETMAIDYYWDRTNALNRFCRSDQVSYFRHTIPVTYFSTGYSIDYHMPTDEPQYIDYEHSARVGRFVHEIMSAVANRPARLRILPPEERDMSAQCGR
ncbi:MAG: M28 family peptidase [Longimicrobiales bacterium]